MRTIGKSALIALLGMVALPAGLLADSGGLQYPSARKGDVVDDYHGVKIPDPYRWMEDLDGAETRAWVTAENAVTSRYLEQLPLREAFKRRITELWNYPKVSVPFREAGSLFYRKNTGLQRQAPFYMRPSTEAPAKLLVDPNVLFPDGSSSVSGYAPSPDGRTLAYATSDGGSDWETIHVRDIAAGKDLPDTLRWVRFSSTSWTKDGQGFYYSRYPEPPKGEELKAAAAGQRLCYHRIGTDQAKDLLIYERKDLPTWFVGGGVSEDGRYLLIYFARGADRRNRLYVAGLGDPKKPNLAAPVRPLVEADDAEYAPLGNVGSVVYLSTDLDAPKRRIVSLDLRNPDRKRWKTVVPQASDAIENPLMAGNRLVLHYLVDVQSRVRFFSLDGKPQGDLALPGVGTVDGLSGRQDTAELFYEFTSPLVPASVFRYDFTTKKSAAFESACPQFDAGGYETKEVFYASKDGTRVPMFITARKDLPRDGSNPTLLYAYGGFSVSETPTYSPDVPAWLERGGVFATANLRGGAEYGEEWHRAGMLEKKQNVFDDFIAAAEYLVREKITSPEKLAIRGASNGGLLVGAAMEQRPDLFAVALPAVGVMDMLRYHRFTAGVAWMSEYGSPDDPTTFAALRAYSPLHNLKPGTCYPATLVTTADHDDRVVPSHSFKFAATLQAAQGCGRPALIRIETQQSHVYAPTDRQIEELADGWAFTAANLGMTTPGAAGEGAKR